ncbi:hypothetical protein RFF73_10880, partial [Streptococcus ruminantium]|nr:hypothetical protein [Streptococcus ruminantium]
KQYQKGVQLTNQIRGIEEKLYQYEYNISTINAMNKRLKKIKKKIDKEKKTARLLASSYFIFQI